MTTGAASRETIQRINIEGTLNDFRAAAAAGARRFVDASSVAAYGFHRNNPVGMAGDWPARPAAHVFCAQEKAEIGCSNARPRGTPGSGSTSSARPWSSDPMLLAPTLLSLDRSRRLSGGLVA